MKRCLRLLRLCGLSLRLLLGVCCCAAVLPGHAGSTLKVGVLASGESRLLGEVVAESVRRTGGRAAVIAMDGDARKLFSALRGGLIDVYACDTGTLALELPGLPSAALPEEFEQRLGALGLSAGLVLGFAVQQGLAMTGARASAMNIRGISGLRKLPGLRLGLPRPFLQSRGGWHTLRDSYELDGLPLVEIDGPAAFDALMRDRVDVILVQATDPRIRSLGLRMLDDDWAVFREYPMVLVYNSALPKTPSAAWRGLASLQGSLSADSVISMRMAMLRNAATPADAARAWLDSGGGRPVSSGNPAP